jgi:hypothetical protein
MVNLSVTTVTAWIVIIVYATTLSHSTTIGVSAQSTASLSATSSGAETGDFDEESTSSFVCNICGEGRIMTLPENVVESMAFPIQQMHEVEGRNDIIITCNDLQRSGSMGLISSIECPLVQPFVQDLCGCVVVPITNNEKPGGEQTEEDPTNDSNASSGVPSQVRSHRSRFSIATFSGITLSFAAMGIMI